MSYGYGAVRVGRGSIVQTALNKCYLPGKPVVSGRP
jgi:hypothetical protein